MPDDTKYTDAQIFVGGNGDAVALKIVLPNDRVFFIRLEKNKAREIGKLIIENANFVTPRSEH